MVTIDQRTRYEGDAIALEVDEFVTTTLAEATEAVNASSLDARVIGGEVPLTLVVEGDAVTLRRTERGINAERATPDDSVVVSVDQMAFSDLMQDVMSAFGAYMTGRATIDRGTIDDFVGWEPLLRFLLDWRPLYLTGSIEFHDRSGRTLNLHRSFTLNDDHDEIGHFLSQAGYLHLQSVFGVEEMAAVHAELDAAAAKAERDDGNSWWARTSGGEWFASRVLGFNQQSPTLRELLRSSRFRQIGTFTDDRFVQRDPDRGDSAEGLVKKVGVVEGISDVSWHKDCAMGGHSRACCGLTVGISVTGGGPENGELGAVAGSHRANVAPLGIEGLDLPRIPLPTRTGDVTVHCSCTLHMSRPPVSAERRVVYTGFGLAPRAGDRQIDLSPEEVRRQRAALNEQTRSQLGEGSARMGSFDL